MQDRPDPARDRERQTLHPDLEELLRGTPGPELPQRLPDPDLRLTGTQLIGPTWAWLAVIFLVVYVGLSGALDASGIGSGHVMSLPTDVLVFGILGALAAAALTVFKPTVVVRTGGRLAPPGPWVAATLGGLLVWGVTHNTVPWLRPFADMDGLEAIAFLGINIVEHALYGFALASFVRRPLPAFALGAGLAATVLGLWTWIAFL